MTKSTLSNLRITILSIPPTLEQKRCRKSCRLTPVGMLHRRRRRPGPAAIISTMKLPVYPGRNDAVVAGYLMWRI
ncbi:hypothetical protein KCP75_17565 [Salmonella enterica subsp. enterica]|nr:hypothetical protein KCP75_17565 [Salmonella enterica subsp. enterica]